MNDEAASAVQRTVGVAAGVTRRAGNAGKAVG